MSDELFYLTTEELGDKLIKSNDSNEVNRIISIFNANLAKKEIIRAQALSDLQDEITKQMGKRVENNSDCFSNQDLLSYMKTIQQMLDSQKNAGVDVPKIAIQNNVTINQEELSKDSRDRISEFIQSVLRKKQDQDLDVIEVVEEKDGEQIEPDEETT